MLGMFGALLWRKQKTLGQTVAEYALIVALIGIASIGILSIFGQQLRSLYASMVSHIAGTGKQQADYTTNAETERDRNVGLNNF